MSDDILKAEEKILKTIGENIDKNRIDSDNKNRWRRMIVIIRYYFYAFFLLAGILVFIFRYPYIKELSEKPTILRNGTYNTDEITDMCIHNIWRIMSDRSLKLKCPASGKDYVVTEKLIACPNPELHGFSKIASENNGTPEVR